MALRRTPDSRSAAKLTAAQHDRIDRQIGKTGFDIGSAAAESQGGAQGRHKETRSFHDRSRWFNIGKSTTKAGKKHYRRQKKRKNFEDSEFHVTFAPTKPDGGFI